MNVENAIVKLESDNFEYVLNENGFISEDSPQLDEEFQNVVYAGSSSVLLEGNEYYIQTTEGPAFVLNSGETIENLYVNEQSEDDLYVEEDVVYKVGGENGLKMENGKFVGFGASEDLTSNDVSNDNSIQYAVLKDGQLHLQISETDTVEILNNQDFAENHLEVQLSSENEEENFDLTDIKGRNILTGKTVSLNDYIERIAGSTVKSESSNSFLNQKFTIGRKPNGKYLVGKILNIQTPESVEVDNKSVIEEVPNNKIQELIFDSAGNIIEISDGERDLNGVITEEQVDFLSKTLNGLTEMSNIQKKLLGKWLEIKLIERKIDEDGESEKRINEVSGYLTEEITDDNNLNYSFHMEEENVQTRDPKETTSLIIATTMDNKGQKSTKVTFTDRIKQLLECDLCEREFKTRTQLTRHISSYHTDKTTFCYVCNLEFKDAASLAAHRKESDHYFPCNVCGRKFTSQTTLKRHNIVHNVSNQAKLFECSLCGKRFVDEMTLFRHLSAHKESTPKCYYCETCGRQFSRHSNLLRHEEIHGGQGNLHKCTVCGCSYKFVSSLTRHIVQNHVKKS